MIASVFVVAFVGAFGVLLGIMKLFDLVDRYRLAKRRQRALDSMRWPE
jgi:hypothetical protein